MGGGLLARIALPSSLLPLQYVERSLFPGKAVDSLSLLTQTMSGLAHLHSLNIGETPPQQGPLPPPPLEMEAGCHPGWC